MYSKKPVISPCEKFLWSIVIPKIKKIRLRLELFMSRLKQGMQRKSIGNSLKILWISRDIHLKSEENQ